MLMNKKDLTIKPISKELLHTKIADAIIEYIKNNELVLGDKIPPERTLAELFSTSRNSVREALKVLEYRKIIEVRRGKGMFVASHVPEESIYLNLWKANYEEILEVKYSLEKYIVEELCKKNSEDQFVVLEEILEKVEKAAEIGVYLQEQDVLFHKKLRNLSKNETLIHMIDNLVEILNAFGSAMIGVDQIWISTIPYHREILEGIRSHDIKKAGDACEKIFKIDLYTLHLAEEFNLKA